jgi:hypothetical protein
MGILAIVLSFFSRALKTLSTIPLAPFLARKGEEII